MLVKMYKGLGIERFAQNENRILTGEDWFVRLGAGMPSSSSMLSKRKDFSRLTETAAVKYKISC